MSGDHKSQVRAMLALILLLFLMPILESRPPATMLPGQQKGNCTYAVEIETTCARFAATADHVGVRFGDAEGNHVIAKELKHPEPIWNPKMGKQNKDKQWNNYTSFDRCAIDSFEVEGPCMQRGICCLFLKRVGADEWRPGWAKVLHKNSSGLVSPVSDTFYFRMFLPSNVWFGFDYCDMNPPHPPLNKK